MQVEGQQSASSIRNVSNEGGRDAAAEANTHTSALQAEWRTRSKEREEQGKVGQQISTGRDEGRNAETRGLPPACAHTPAMQASGAAGGNMLDADRRTMEKEMEEARNQEVSKSPVLAPADAGEASTRRWTQDVPATMKPRAALDELGLPMRPPSHRSRTHPEDHRYGTPGGAIEDKPMAMSEQHRYGKPGGAIEDRPMVTLGQRRYGQPGGRSRIDLWQRQNSIDMGQRGGQLRTDSRCPVENQGCFRHKGRYMTRRPEGK